jgi:hypothetical protein
MVSLEEFIFPKIAEKCRHICRFSFWKQGKKCFMIWKPYPASCFLVAQMLIIKVLQQCVDPSPRRRAV